MEICLLQTSGGNTLDEKNQQWKFVMLNARYGEHSPLGNSGFLAKNRVPSCTLNSPFTLSFVQKRVFF